jgi:phage terminase large subunit-like protein
MLKEMAIRYANDVIEGREPTTKYVKIQCQWFLRDLERIESDEFPYFIDEDFIDTVEGILALLNFATGIDTQGKTVLEGLHDFQGFFLFNVFGWKFKSKPYKDRYQDVDMFCPRKSAKSFLNAIVLIILLLTEENYSEFYSISVDRSLAGEIKKAISQVLEASPHIFKYFTIPKTLSGKIVCKLNQNFYQPRTADPTRNNGLRGSSIIMDEVGSFTDVGNIQAMKSGQLSVRNARRFKLTTAYPESNSIYLEDLSYIKKVFDGHIEDDRMFALLYYAEEGEEWSDLGILQANPLKIPENIEEIKRNRQKALESPLEREEFLCKHQNIFLSTNSAESYVTIEDLRKCRIESFDWNGKQVWCGLDLSLTTDNCCVSFVTVDDDLNIYGEAFVFIPSLRIEEKNRFEKIRYEEFIKAGKCFAVGDMTVDYNAIEDFCFSLEEKFGVTIMGFSYDRYNALSTAQKLDKVYRTVECKQHASILHPATKLLREAILNQKFHYTPNKLLELNFQNARCTYNNNMDMYVNKKRSDGKVDVVTSLLNAVYLLQTDVIFNADQDWGVQVI